MMMRPFVSSLWLAYLFSMSARENPPLQSGANAMKSPLAFAASTTPSSSANSRPAADAAPVEQQQQQQEGGEEIGLLPPPDPDSKLPSIKFGETIKFKEMGPVIINSDGTTRRIENWNEMTDKEKEVAWRRISKRNEERKKALLQQQQPQQQQTESSKDEL